MAENPKDKDSEDDPRAFPPESDVRVFSDFILYFTARGKFQDFPIESKGRRQGIRELLGERIVRLTQERRLRPVRITLTVGQKSERVYLVAGVRKGKQLSR